MDQLELDGASLGIDDVVLVARGEHSSVPKVIISADSEAAVLSIRETVDRLTADGQAIYGITTGVGPFQDRYIPPSDVVALQRNLLVSHAAGLGPEFPEDVVRACMLVRANTLAKGYSGITLPTLRLLVEMINRRVHPIIPSLGSVGASGDLAPLAHVALTMVGLGEAMYQGQRLAGGEALSRAGLAPLQLQAKEALALLNGTAVMTGIGSLLVHDALRLLFYGDLSGAITLESLGGLATPFLPEVHRIRPHPFQADSAARVRSFIAGSKLLGHELLTAASNSGRIHVQDPYCLRCMPQVHGASAQAIDYARQVVAVELNSATDNPLFLDFGDGFHPVSQGNFHGQPIALAMDFLGIAVAELASVAERRIARLTGQHQGPIPRFLAAREGLNSGFMMAQHTAAALVSENKSLAHPASVDSIPTCDNWEDHVSMGTIAARKAAQILANAERVVGIELLLATQAIDFSLRSLGLEPEIAMGVGTLPAYRAVREVVSFVDSDLVLAPLMNAAISLICGEDLRRRVEVALENQIALDP